MKRRYARNGFYIMMLFLVFSFVGCGSKKDMAVAGIQAIPVKVTKVKLENIEKTLEHVGNIKAKDEAGVYPKVSGKIIEKVKEEGSVVKRDDVIAYVDRDEVGFTFEKAPVEAPIEGVVGRMYVDIGSSVTPSTEIALVINMDQVKINIQIPEKYLPQIAIGQSAKVTVDAYPDKVFEGKVTKISPVLDLETRSAPLEITIDNPYSELKSGMFARVKLIVQMHKNVVVVPKEAILGSGDKSYCFIILSDKAVLQPITTGLKQGPDVEVLSGLKKDDEVVIMGQQKLFDGALVVVEREG